MKMDNVCQQLDETVLEIFQVLEDLYEQQNLIKQVMAEGYLNISRARYSMGVKRVSVDNITDADLSANITVNVAESICSDFDELSNTGSPIPEKKFERGSFFSLNQNAQKESVIQKDGEEISTQLDQLNIDGPRRRNPKSSQAADKVADSSKETETDESENLVKRDDSSKKDKTKSSRSNPLNLFGVLVPQPLREGQKKFEEAAKMSVSLADMFCHLNILRNNYQRLLKLKNELAQEDTATDGGQ